MRQRLLYLCKFFLITVMLFIMAKIAFMLLDHEGHTFTVSDMFDVIWHGLTLDLSTALYILIVPFLVTLVSCGGMVRCSRRFCAPITSSWPSS